MGITTGVRPPIRSRTFTEQDAKTANAALVESRDAGNENEGVGYGDFNSAESARSAGSGLNKMILSLGLSDHKWATTVFKVTVPKDPSEPDGEQVEKYRGVMLPKKAKDAPPRKTAATKSSGGRKRG